MTHELIQIINAFQSTAKRQIKCVLVTVVNLNGSSYRKPGVRMLISEDGTMTGAVSGGCVEKEIKRQSTSVFNTGTPKIMTYDGRYRLGCEGLIYILIEPFHPDDRFLEAFYSTLNERKTFRVESYYAKEIGSFDQMGSVFYFSDTAYPLQHTISEQSEFLTFAQTLKPNFKLCIFGHEHDAIELCKLSTMCGWEVHIYSSSPEIEHLSGFSSAKTIHHILPNDIKQISFDSETAVVLMTHNFAKDLAYLQELATLSTSPNYIGVIGSKKRMRQLESALFEHHPYLDEAFIKLIHGPAGLNIGSVTPQEIAISIISEITQNVRTKTDVKAHV